MKYFPGYSELLKYMSLESRTATENFLQGGGPLCFNSTIMQFLFISQRTLKQWNLTIWLREYTLLGKKTNEFITMSQIFRATLPLCGSYKLLT